jgi:signal transduction histidine kinase
MLEENNRLSQTVESLLLLARADAMHMIAEKSDFRLPEIVDEVVDLLEALLDERSIKVNQIDRDQGLGWVSAERMLIRAALINVMHNAIKFSPPGSDIVVSYSQRTRGSNPMQHVLIQDSGVGIPVAELHRVFDRFYTGSSREGAGKTGSGLGLSIAKLAVERNRGDIYFEQNTFGAACCIDLPIVDG